MELKLEDLKYQDEAIESVIKVFDGTEKNTFDNACLDGIRSNICKLPKKAILENIGNVAEENGIHEDIANISEVKRFMYRNGNRNRKNPCVPENHV